MQRGFTLVELSIVLVILGLLVGGVLAGQSLIHAAELRSVTREYNQYVVALNAFRGKYSQLPGNMTNAVRFWGSSAGSAPSNLADGEDPDCLATLEGSNTPSVGTATCNGDGDNRVYYPETFRAWQHLSNAGLIEGTYTGVSSAAGFIDPGSNMPASKIGGGASWLFQGDDGIWGNDERHHLMIGSDDDNTCCRNDEGQLKAEDAYNIDTKLDDGKPITGQIVNYSNNSDYPDCVNATDDGYQLDSTVAKACVMQFLLGY